MQTSHTRFILLVLVAMLIYSVVWHFTSDHSTSTLITRSNFIRSSTRSSSSNDINAASSVNEKYNFTAKYPFFKRCNTTLNEKEPIPPRNYVYEDVSSNERQRLRVSRALILHYKSSNEEELEFRWLYRSWVEMIRYEPAKWRTDLIIFIDMKQVRELSFLAGFNCSQNNRRQSLQQMPMCTLIDYKPLRARQFNSTNNKNDNIEHLLSDVDIFSRNPNSFLSFYSFLNETGVLLNSHADSIQIAFDGYDYFKEANFNFVIRTDVDVFLAPLFGKWFVSSSILKLKFFILILKNLNVFL